MMNLITLVINKVKESILSFILNLYMNSFIYKRYIYNIYRFEQQVKKINKDNKELLFNLKLYNNIPYNVKTYLYNKYHND